MRGGGAPSWHPPGCQEEAQPVPSRTYRSHQVRNHEDQQRNVSQDEEEPQQGDHVRGKP